MHLKQKRRAPRTLVRRSRRRPSRGPAITHGALAAAAIAAGVLGGGLAAWKRRGAKVAGAGGANAGGAGTAEHPDQRHPWQCECGQDLQTSGDGLHRIFWMPGAEPGDPLLEGRCPNCDRALTRQD